jgi:hypothetical protein
MLWRVMAGSQWFFGRNGVHHGPVSDEVLRRMVDSGELRPDELVWREGMAAWQPAQEVPGLLDVVAVAPPPLPGPGEGPRVGTPTYMPGSPLGYARPNQTQAAPQGIGADAGMRMILPVGRSGWAIAAGYLGLLSLGCFFLSPVAIVCSVMAMRDMKLHPERHGMGRVITGFVLGGIGMIILCVFSFSLMRRL